MSVVSRDVVFHVKFDLEGAKKDLEKKQRSSEPEEHPQASTRGAPNKASAKSKRGLNTAEQLAVTNAMLKGSKVPGTTAASRIKDKLTVEAGRQKVVLSAKASRVLKSFITLSLASGRPPNPEFIKHMMKAGKEYNVERSIFRLNQKATAAAKGIADETDILSAGMWASIGKKGLGLAKGALRFGKGITPALALYEIANNSSAIAAGYAAAGASGFGGDWAATNLSKAKGYAQNLWLSTKAIVGKPIAFIGYDNDMAKQGHKGFSATLSGFIGGSNLGTIKYDIDQAQTRLTNAVERCQAMQVGQSYGKAWTETGLYKGIFDVSLRTCDAVGSLFRKR
jgi:hypothetical protein